VGEEVGEGVGVGEGETEGVAEGFEVIERVREGKWKRESVCEREREME
jgi:hypothetical protein